MTKNNKNINYWLFWLQWTLANGFSWLIGMSLAWILASLISPLVGERLLVAFWLVAGLLIGAGFSVNHFFLFRSISNRFDGDWVGKWFVVTTLGWGFSLGLISGVGVAAEQGFAISGVLLGVIVGLLQWIILRPNIPRAWIWIPAQTLAWGIAIALIDVWIQAVGFAFSGFISGLISGGVLAYLMRSTDPNLIEN